MEFNIKKRDGPARTGELTVNAKKIITPNILFVDTQRFKAPDFADVLLTNEKKTTRKPILKFSDKLLIQKIKEKSNTLFIVENALQLFKQAKKFIEYIVNLKEKVGYQTAIYLPSTGNPINLSLLTYLGIDLYDSTSAIIAARNNILLFETGSFQTIELEEIQCSCPSCCKIKKKPIEMNFQEILNHNYYAINTEIKHVRNAIAQENLRNLVEKRVKANPNLTAILRNLDRYHYNYLEKRTPIHSNNKLIATSIESLNRPEIKRFQERIISRYKKPESARILLLLPCSAKKPYSFSKSHKLFKEKIITTKNPQIIHEVIITSPIGIVPRELELIYPASSYDIPVTGVWNEQEKKMITNLLSKYLEINKYEKIITHLPEEINDFIKSILKDVIETCKNNPTSKESLEYLFETLNTIVSKFEKIKPKNRAREDLQALASYQFDKKIAAKLLKDTYIKGKYPYQKIIKNNTQLGMITKERGLISLTLAGSKKLFDSKNHWVEIYDDFTLKGSVLAPGVKNADSSIRIGEEVIVIKNNKLIGVGVAEMNGEEMIKLNYGVAVKVRHRA
jgi:archaeosine synthase